MTLVCLVTPASAAGVTPSPAGATVAAACFLALVAPVGIGWACGRGDDRLETMSDRPIKLMDLGYAGGVVGLGAASLLLLGQVGLAPAGLLAGRDELLYLGLLLIARPLLGWSRATAVPAVYLLAVAILGRGDDVDHPAWWAFVAANGQDQASWLATAGLLLIGSGLCIALPPRLGQLGDP